MPKAMMMIWLQPLPEGTMTLYSRYISKLKYATASSVFVEQQPVADTVLHGLASAEASAE